MKNHDKVLKQIADWNASHPEGTAVDLTTDDIDHGVVVRTKTRSVAWGLGDTNKPHTAVVLVSGKTGGWELDRIRVVPAGSVPVSAELLPYCRVCGTSELAARPMSPELGAELVCGVFVYKNGAHVGHCHYAGIKALERAALLCQCRPMLRFVSAQPELSNELRPLIAQASKLIAEIDKLPKAVTS